MEHKLSDPQLKELIVIATKRLDNAQSKSLRAAKELGLLLIEAKKRYPKVKDFEAFLKDAGGVKLARAYELIGLVGGRIDEAKHREENAKRNREHRAKKKAEAAAAKKFPSRDGKPEPPKLSVTSSNVTESAEISIEQRRGEHAELDQSAEERVAKWEPLKWSADNLHEFECACKTYLPRLNEADLKTARAYVTFDRWRAKKVA
jgi:hypothetical protein